MHQIKLSYYKIDATHPTTNLFIYRMYVIRKQKHMFIIAMEIVRVLKMVLLEFE